MHIIMLGAPGVGKGTQAQFIMKNYSIPQISTGEMLRDAVKKQSELGKQVNWLMNVGKLINDELIINLVKERINQNDCSHGFLLDGFPRTLSQAKSIKKSGIVVDYVLVLVVPDTLLVERIVGRRIHVPSGRIYHVQFNPPRKEGKDDITGEPLITRKDDLENTVRKRFVEYQQQTAPLIDYYRNEYNVGNLRYFSTIDGTRNINDISAELANIMVSH